MIDLGKIIYEGLAKDMREDKLTEEQYQALQTGFVPVKVGEKTEFFLDLPVEEFIDMACLCSDANEARPYLQAIRIHADALAAAADLIEAEFWKREQ